LREASADLLAAIDELATDGKLVDAMGRTISVFSSQGLVSENGEWLYSMENDTPSLLAEEAVFIGSSLNHLQ
jgi:hypothetical protein